MADVVVALDAVGTVVPPFKVPQQHALAFAQENTAQDNVSPLLPRIYKNSAIQTRFMSIPDFTPDSPADAKPFFTGAAGDDGVFAVSVEERFAKFKEVAEDMVVEATTKALKTANCVPADIKRVIIASSTGFLAPGLEATLVERMGFSRDAHMSFLGFMGCAAGVSGIRACLDFCMASPGEKALVIAIDLASPHASFGGGINEAVLHAIFADGCAAIVLSGVRRRDIKAGQVTIDNHFSHLFEGTLDGITLKIHTKGVTCILSKYLPAYIKKGLSPIVLGFLKSCGLAHEDVDHWVVHPGGTRIIEACQASLDLPESELQYSWEVLRDHGNMLGPCVLFVLEKFMEEARQALERGDTTTTTGLCFSFAPGVRVEGLLLKFNGKDGSATASAEEAKAGDVATTSDASAAASTTVATTSAAPAVASSAAALSTVAPTALAAFFAASTPASKLSATNAALAVASVATLSLLTTVAVRKQTAATNAAAPKKSSPWLAAGLAAVAVGGAVFAGLSRRA